MTSHRFWLLLLCALLVLGALLVAESAPQASAPPRPAPRWVRTRNGWRQTHWDRPSAANDADLHPWLLSSFMVLASSASLLAFSKPVDRAGQSTPTEPS